MNKEQIEVYKRAAQKTNHVVRINAEDLLALIALAERTSAPVSVMTPAQIKAAAMVAWPDLPEDWWERKSEVQKAVTTFADAILAAAAPQAQAEPVALRDFKDGIHRLTMRHIDRMNDVCDEDTAQQIIKSFTEGFDSLYDTYMALRVREIEADRAAKPQADESGLPG